MVTILVELMARMPYKYEVCNSAGRRGAHCHAGTQPSPLPAQCQDARPASMFGQLFRPLADDDQMSEFGTYALADDDLETNDTAPLAGAAFNAAAEDSGASTTAQERAVDEPSAAAQ